MGSIYARRDEALDQEKGEGLISIAVSRSNRVERKLDRHLCTVSKREERRKKLVKERERGVGTWATEGHGQRVGQPKFSNQSQPFVIFDPRVYKWSHRWE